MQIYKKLLVEGMSCQHCKHNIETSLKELDGVMSVTAHHQDGYVDVDFDDSQVQLEKITEAIEDLGFDVK